MDYFGLCCFWDRCSVVSTPNLIVEHAMRRRGGRGGCVRRFDVIIEGISERLSALSCNHGQICLVRKTLILRKRLMNA